MPAWVRLRSLFAVLCVTTIALLLFILQPAFLVGLQLRIEDWVVSLTDVGKPAENVAIVDLDEASVTVYGRWPWPRDQLARLISATFDAGADAVAIDMMFPEADSAGSRAFPGKSNDQVLADSFAGRRVVVGHHFGFDRAPPAPSCVLHPVEITSSVAKLNLFQATQVLCTLPVLSGAAAASGFLNASPDADGVLRRVPLLISYRNRVYPSLALSAWLLSRGGALRISEEGLQLQPGHSQAPIGARASLRLRFHGPSGTILHYSAARIMAHPQERPLRDKVVFIGTSARGVSDAVATPVDSNMPGVEVVATTLDNLLQGDGIADSGPARSLELIFILIACAVSGALAMRARSLWAAPLLIACAAVLCVMCIGLLAIFKTLVSPLIFTAAIGANFGIVMLLRFTDEKKRADSASQKVVEARNFLLHTLTLLAGARDAETGAHLIRTQRYTRLLCDTLAGHPKFAHFLTKETIDLIVQIVPLHDIGKIGVPDSILKKPGSLTPEEYKIIQRHVEYGYEVLEKARIRAGIEDENVLQLARDIVGSHHERWDGKGYPLGLKAELIPIPGRLVSVVDMYDALVSKRVYKDRISHEEAATLIAESRGERFDPDVVDAFLRTQDQWREVALQCQEDEQQGGD